MNEQELEVPKTARDLGYVEEPVTTAAQKRGAIPVPPTKEQFSNQAQGKTASELGYSEQAPTTPGMDLVKSGISAVQNVPIGVLGLPGTINQLLRSGVGAGVEKAEELGTRGYSWLRGESKTPEGEQRLLNMQKRQEEGRALLGAQSRLPTSQDIAEFVEPYVNKAGVPGPLYEPSTTEGKYLKTGIEFAAPGLAGKQKLLSTGVGALSGLTSEFAGQTAKSAGLSPGYETAARVISALAAGVYAPRMISTVGNIMAPTAEAERRLATEIASARSAGRAPSDAEIQTALTEMRQRAASGAGTPGEQLVAYDLLGKQGAKTVERGLVSQEGKKAASLIDDFIETRQAETAQRVDRAFDSIHGRPIQADVTRASMQRGIDVDNPKLFNQARNSPKAVNVETPVTDSILADPLARDAVVAAMRTFRNTKPTNLAFYHEVKTNLDYMVDRAFKNNDGLLGNQLKGIRDNLRNDLKTTVPEYGTALDSASSFFKGKNAIDSGVNFAGSKYTMPEIQDARRAYSKYGADQKRQFEEGYLYQLRENAKNSTGSSVIPNLQNEYEKMAALFGRQKADRLYATATAEDVINLKKAIDFQKAGVGAPGPFEGGIRSISIPGGFGAMSAFLMNPSSSGLMLSASAGVAGAAGAARRLMLNAEERKIVGEINKILSSGNPQQIERLSRMATHNPNVNSVLDKYKEFMTTMVQAGPSAGRSMAGEGRQERKSGGRVMTAQQMLAAAERAKKDINKGTEVLLKTDDSHVAHALEIANKNLEV